MRPYMQWLAVAYTGRICMINRVPNRSREALEDWITYQQEQRWSLEAARR